MRRNVEFDADGVTLRGWLYVPEVDLPAPAVVMAHGFVTLKEMYLDDFAERFADAGLCVLVYDNRTFGDSDGEPRREADPIAQARDYRHAISYLRSLDEVDSERVGAWGTCYSGGHVLMLTATDPRVKCVVSQIPFVSGHNLLRRLVRADLLAEFQDQLAADREARFAGAAPARVPVVCEDRMAPCAIQSSDSFEWFDEVIQKRGVAWDNDVTLRSVELASEYEPGAYIEWVSPTPLLMIVASKDHVTPTDEALAAYGRAREPKKLVVLPGGHYDAYVDHFALASTAARDWFVQHLKPAQLTDIGDHRSGQIKRFAQAVAG